MKVRFRVCCCLYDYYVYIHSTKTVFTIYSNSYRQRDHGFTFTFCDDEQFVQVFYKCIYNSLLTRKFDQVRLNQLLNQTCQTYYAYSSYLERINGAAKNYFGVIKDHLIRDNATTDRNFVMTGCYFACFKNLIFHFLSDEFYYVDSVG